MSYYWPDYFLSLLALVQVPWMSVLVSSSSPATNFSSKLDSQSTMQPFSFLLSVYCTWSSGIVMHQSTVTALGMLSLAYMYLIALSLLFGSKLDKFNLPALSSKNASSMKTSSSWSTTQLCLPCPCGRQCLRSPWWTCSWSMSQWIFAPRLFHMIKHTVRCVMLMYIQHWHCMCQNFNEIKTHMSIMLPMTRH